MPTRGGKGADSRGQADAEPDLVIGYAATTPDRLREGVRLLADVVD